MIRKTIAHYEIGSLIGKGGMGEVYRATDTKLKREVALKILPDSFARDPQRMGRFQREAEVLASLSHPNIAVIHGLECEGGTHAIAMELVKGETLAAHISQGAIPLEEALKIALQISEALEAAHEKGIVHRDLKPANVMITTVSSLKVLDFGLAKTMAPEPASGDDLSQSPTLTMQATQQGVLLGTAAYMSPEQARGQPVDKRTDIWAFGAVLYEMLSGRKAFEGEDFTVLASIIKSDPAIETLPQRVPARLKRLLGRCLQKEQQKRLRDIGDARIELEEILADPESRTAPAAVAGAARLSMTAPWILVAIILIAGWFLWPTEQANRAGGEVRFKVGLPPGKRLGYLMGGDPLALSPDGRVLAFLGGQGVSAISEEPQLFAQQFDEWVARPIAGTEGAISLVFSPNSDWIAFVQVVDGQSYLKKVRPSGSSLETLCSTCRPWGSIDWSDDRRILFSSGSRLFSIPETGGLPEALTEGSADPTILRYLTPSALPAGKGLLFAQVRDNVMLHLATTEVLVSASGEQQTLIENALDARYVDSGHLVFAREGDLWAIRFDLETLQTSGTEKLILEGVNHFIRTRHTREESGVAQFSLSRGGTLAYVPGGIFPEAGGELLWANRQGQVEVIGMPPRIFTSVRSLSDRYLVMTDYFELWRWDIKRQQPRNLGGNGIAWLAAGPGPSAITYQVQRNQGPIYTREINADPGTERKLLDRGAPIDWTPDGRTLLYLVGGDIWALTDGEMRPILESPEYQVRYPDLSPDGNWIAYASDESGAWEVYVRPFPGPGDAEQISIEGGQSPVFTPDSSEVIFRCVGYGPQADCAFWAVALRISGAGMDPARPVKLFERTSVESVPLRSWDIGPDGRFLLIREKEGESKERFKDQIFPAEIRIIQNWTRILEEKFRDPN